MRLRHGMFGCSRPVLIDMGTLLPERTSVRVLRWGICRNVGITSTFRGDYSPPPEKPSHCAAMWVQRIAPTGR